MAITISDSSSAVSQSQIASTLPHIRNVVKDNVSDKTPLLSFLMGTLGSNMRQSRGLEGGNIPGVIVGGRDIHVPVQLLRNETVASYSGADELDISHQDTDRYALYPIRQVSGALTIIGRELRANKGDAAIYSLMESKANRLMEDMRQNLNEQAIADGTGNAGKDILGLAAIVGTGSLAGLNPSTFPKWQPGGFASGHSRHAINTSAAGNLVSNWRDNMTRLTFGTDRPDAFVVARDTWGLYTADIEGNIRYGQVEVGDANFKTLEFMGVPVFLDHVLSDGYSYQLNSAHIQFVRDTAADFDWLDEGVRPANQDVFARVMIVEGNVVTDNRRMHGEVSGLT